MTYKEAIQEVIDALRDWSCYASEYFQEKHNLKRDLEIAGMLEEAIKNKEVLNLNEEIEEERDANP